MTFQQGCDALLSVVLGAIGSSGGWLKPCAMFQRCCVDCGLAADYSHTHLKQARYLSNGKAKY